MKAPSPSSSLPDNGRAVFGPVPCRAARAGPFRCSDPARAHTHTPWWGPCNAAALFLARGRAAVLPRWRCGGAVRVRRVVSRRRGLARVGGACALEASPVCGGEERADTFKGNTIVLRGTSPPCPPLILFALGYVRFLFLFSFRSFCLLTLVLHVCMSACVPSSSLPEMRAGVLSCRQRRLRRHVRRLRRDARHRARLLPAQRQRQCHKDGRQPLVSRDACDAMRAPQSRLWFDHPCCSARARHHTKRKETQIEK